MELHLRIAGGLLVFLALLHGGFPRYFHWKEAVKPLSLLNQQIFYVHTFFIALVVFLSGVLCLTSAEEIIHSPLGKKVALGLGIFWTIRLFFQLFVYSPELWQGKKFETAVHVLFSLLWMYLSGVFLGSSLG